MDEAYIEKSSKKDALDILEQLGGWPVILGDKWTDNNFTWYGLAEKANLLGFDTNKILSASEFPLTFNRMSALKMLFNFYFWEYM